MEELIVELTLLNITKINQNQIKKSHNGYILEVYLGGNK